MTHLWIRSEQRNNEKRVGVTPEGAKYLIKNGFKVTIENCNSRIISILDYEKSGCEIVKQDSWVNAPKEAIILGLKEILDRSAPLHHNHIMFGHAFKDQRSGLDLLKRFKNDGGKLYDLEYLLDDTGKRVAAFGYWAGFAGAAVSVKVWLCQKLGKPCNTLTDYDDKQELLNELKSELSSFKASKPSAIVIGALGRVGTGASDLLSELGIEVTKWDISETANGGPFPEILKHNLFLNCIVATKNSPVFLAQNDLFCARRLSVIGDIACDPDSDYNPIAIYDKPTTWGSPSKLIQKNPVLEVVAIDNLPALLPKESSTDFASQLLPYLKDLNNLNSGIWSSAEKIFEEKIRGV